jgi:glycosyltransferase involved in cell wall biosynthesis
MKKPRVLFDAGPMLDARKSGVGYYVQSLVHSLEANYADQLELTGYYFNFLRRRQKIPQDKASKFHEIWLIPGRILSVCRRLGFQLPLEFFTRIPRDVDTVFFTNYVALPLLHRRKIMLAIYDLSFLDVPEFSQTLNLRYLKQFCAPSIRRADTIVTISEFTKQRLLHHFPDLKAQIIVTPIPPLKTPEPNTGLSRRLTDMSISPNAYILYVGTIEPRKNLEALVRAYEQLNPELQGSHSLVLAGGKGWKDVVIRETISKLQDKGLHIILTGYVSDEEKSALYSNASCFVLPSHYEGFGMPILEAMQHGTPTVVSDIPVFHEVAGAGALYFDKDNIADIAQQLAVVLTDKKTSEQITQAAIRQLQTFSWQDNAAKVYQALD